MNTQQDLTTPWVAVLAGSASDKPVIQATLETLQQLGIRREMRVLSAHRTPAQLQTYLTDAQQRGCAVFIAIAGMAAHLGGVIASHSSRPVIGVPNDASMSGLDALLATVQMPPGVPVAAMSIGVAGGRNAALFAAQILAIGDEALTERLQQRRLSEASKVLARGEALQKELQQYTD